MSPPKKKTDEEKKTRMSLREQILGADSAKEFSSRKRGTHVMTRLGDDVIEVLDALVELGIFKSRSEAVAAYVEKSILTQMDQYQALMKKAKQVGKMRDEAMDVALEIFQGSKD
ncbi:MAG: hypothetical protein ACXAEF_15070 [Candidatus Thorarchaeota archaeon]|jgi:Arc/MetJ-type ribon-helix-helix transcriptional regulator